MVRWRIEPFNCRTSAQRSGQRGKRTVLPRQGRKPLKTRLKSQDFPGSSGKSVLFFYTVHGAFLFGMAKRKGGWIPSLAPRRGAKRSTPEGGNPPTPAGLPGTAQERQGPPGPRRISPYACSVLGRGTTSYASGSGRGINSGFPLPVGNAPTSSRAWMVCSIVS